MSKLFLYFEITPKKSEEYNKDLLNEVNYLVYFNGETFKINVNQIEELGPRPLYFPTSLQVVRYNDELKFLYHILQIMRTSHIIFSEKWKLKQLYLKLKKMGIRDNYIPHKLRNLEIEDITFNESSLNTEHINLLKKLEKLSSSGTHHWDILYYLYLKTDIMSQLISNNGFKLRKGIFEIKMEKKDEQLRNSKTAFKRKKEKKVGLWRYIDGM